MAKRKHNELDVLASLDRKQDVKIVGRSVLILSSKVYSETFDGLVENTNKSHDLGNGSHGKIDYLVNHCGYNKAFVSNFKN